MLGHMAVRVLSHDYSVFGTTRTFVSSENTLLRFISPEKLIGGIDVREDSALANVFETVKPDFVLNCVGLVKQKMNAESYIESLEINSLLPHRILRICEKYGSKLIQVSTDCVFSCSPGVKHRFDEPDSTDLYGRTKYLGEVTYGNSLTLRTSIVGRQLEGDESLFEWIINQRDKSVSGFEYALYTGLTTMALCGVIAEIVENHPELTGLWQVSSKSISKLQLIKTLNEKLNLGMTIQANSEFHCDRRLDGLDFEIETGISVPSWDEMLQEFVSDQINYE